MKDTRIYSMLLMVLSIFLCLCVVFLVWSWSQQISQQEVSATTPAPVRATPAKASVRDSLQQMYAATVNYLNTQAMAAPQDSSTAMPTVNQTADFERLKTEIAALLKEKGTANDLDLAREKIAELQIKIAQLYSRNENVEAENRRLSALLSQMQALGNDRPLAAAVPPQGANPARPAPAKGANTPLTVGDLQLQAVYINNQDEQETAVAEDAEKLNGSFVVKGQGTQQGNAVVQVVVTQPNGQVLKSNPWESGAFETTEGRKVYSYQFRFDYAKGETRPLRFSLGADRFIQGNYTMQLYYNGQVIGRLTKTLL
jgi:hypothetical protein